MKSDNLSQKIKVVKLARRLSKQGGEWKEIIVPSLVLFWEMFQISIKGEKFAHNCEEKSERAVPLPDLSFV